MTTHNMVKSLIESGYTQTSLSDRLTELGVKTSQPTILRIQKDPQYQTAANRTLKIVTLYEELQQKLLKDKTKKACPAKPG